MDWKPGRARHDRKFMLTNGAAVDPATDATHRSATLAFWGCSGEWKLRTLAPGSIILFGRASRPGGKPSFALDTCIVVDRVERRTSRPLDAEAYGTDLLHDAVLAPLYSEDIHDELSVYFGRRPQPGRSSPFSFFPARVVRGGDPPLFARPELRPVGALEGVVNPAQTQSVKFTSGPGLSQRDAIWSEVVRQVVAQGCALGYYAPPPPVLDRAAVDRLRAQELSADLAGA